MIEFNFIKSKFFIDIHKKQSFAYRNLLDSYPHNGFHYHIMILYLALNKFFKTKLLIESGVGPGHSTKYIMSYVKKNKIRSLSVDFGNNYLNRRVINFNKKNYLSSYIEGDGYFEILKKLKTINSNFSLLVDGPKNFKALSLIYVCFELNKFLKFAIMDDVLKKSKVFNEIKKNKFAVNIYDLMQIDKTFKKNKLQTLKAFYKDEKNYSNITKKNIFYEREYLLLRNNKSFFYPGLLQTSLISFLVKNNLFLLLKIIIKLDNIIFKN
jgi:hypothetical protein